MLKRTIGVRMAEQWRRDEGAKESRDFSGASGR